MSPENFIFPDPASDEDLLLVHTSDYIDKLKSGNLTFEDMAAMELPFSTELAEAAWFTVGGTILTTQIALKKGVGLHIGGGFHHAFPDHGEGFCVFNDIAVAVRRAKKEGKIKKAMIIDCDLHQGNGTAHIFAGEKDVFTLSIHQGSNYPFLKPPSDLDIGLDDGATDEDYMEHLTNIIPKLINDFIPDLIIYVAGADVYKHDQLGGLALTIGGIKQRDRFIFNLARERRIPIASVLAGGYAFDISDTVEIHTNTIKAGLGIG